MTAHLKAVGRVPIEDSEANDVVSSHAFVVGGHCLVFTRRLEVAGRHGADVIDCAEAISGGDALAPLTNAFFAPNHDVERARERHSWCKTRQVDVRG